MSEANKAVVRRLFEEVWNQGKLEVVGELVAQDYVYRTAHLPELRGPEGCKRLFAQFRAVFPDIQFSIDDMIAEGDKVAVRWRFTGKHSGAWGGATPTGKPVTVTGMSLHRLKDGQIVEGLIDQDILGMYEQIGLVTDPATLGANKALVRRFVEEILNKGDLSLVDEVFAADALYRGSAVTDMRGTEAVKQYINAVHRVAFPDTNFTIEELIAEGDMVVLRWTFAGTHKAEWGGIAPTGKQVSITGTTRLRICGGKIVDHWCDWDALKAFQQLGLVPPLGQAQAATAAAGASAHLDGPDA
jgi:steroid delta-isomerase-like uncharacterized protein